MNDRLSTWQHVRALTVHLLWTGDTTGARFVIALASLGWSLSLVLDPHTLDRPAYALMRYVPVWAWAVSFGVHGVLALWRIYERRNRVRWAVTINLLGFSLWTAYTTGITWAIGELPSGAVLEWVMVFRLAVVVARSGLNREVTSA